jgi:hypothetical protein
VYFPPEIPPTEGRTLWPLTGPFWCALYVLFSKYSIYRRPDSMSIEWTWFAPLFVYFSQEISPMQGWLCASRPDMICSAFVYFLLEIPPTKVQTLCPLTSHDLLCFFVHFLPETSPTQGRTFYPLTRDGLLRFLCTFHRRFCLHKAGLCVSGRDIVCSAFCVFFIGDFTYTRPDFLSTDWT